MSLNTQLADSQFYTLPGGARMRYAVFAPSHASGELPRGTILIALGRREFIEKKYAELGMELLERHFRLIIFEWRGQGLSGRLLDGKKRQRDHIGDFNAHLDDLGSFYEAVVKPHQTGPLLVLGHSMGGHLMLRWLAERQKTGIHGAILTAPMLALGPRAAHVVALGVGHLEISFGRGENYAPGQHDYGPEERSFVDNPLTHDAGRFAIMENYFDAHPEMTVGGVTWAWLLAALKSMHDVRHAHYMERIGVPVLTLMGELDRVTPPRELQRYLAHLPQGESVVIPNALHDLMNETDMLRASAWMHIDRFLAKIRAA